MYLGWNFWEWPLPMNPTETHNYLERTYTRAQLVDREYTFEANNIVTSPVYQSYYVFGQKTSVKPISR